MFAVLEPFDYVVISFIPTVALIILSAMLGVLARGSGVNLKSRELARLARLENKMDLLLQHVGLTYDSATEVMKYAKVRAAIDSGDKIHAISLYAEATGISPLDALPAIEEIMARGAGRKT